MFSVLWKKRDTYEEAFPSVAKVWKTPVVSETQNEIVVGVRFNDPDTGEDRFFREGSIYVMNENGRTVATYYLEKPVI